MHADLQLIVPHLASLPPTTMTKAMATPVRISTDRRHELGKQEELSTWAFEDFPAPFRRRVRSSSASRRRLLHGAHAVDVLGQGAVGDASWRPALDGRSIFENGSHSSADARSATGSTSESEKRRAASSIEQQTPSAKPTNMVKSPERAGRTLQELLQRIHVTLQPAHDPADVGLVEEGERDVLEVQRTSPDARRRSPVWARRDGDGVVGNRDVSRERPALPAGRTPAPILCSMQRPYCAAGGRRAHRSTADHPAAAASATRRRTRRPDTCALEPRTTMAR